MDIRCIQAYNRSMSALERRQEAALLRAWRDARPGMLDDLTRFGLRSPALMEQLRQRISLAASRARAAQQAHLDQARDLARRLALCQGVSEATVASVAGAVATLGASQVDAWELATQARYMADVQRLQQGDEDEGQAALVLFAAPLGASDRASTYRRSRNELSLAGSLALWGLASGAVGLLYGAHQTATGVQYSKQAIAAIDERTTDCCLRVHGQIQPLDKPFELTGTPRFGSHMMNPPFHWYCRTATALYRPEMESTGLSTVDLVSAAKAEVLARKVTGKRVEIHPASGTSRR
jgi:hypothetical protein